MRLRQNGRHFPDDVFKCIFLNENVWIPVKISLKLIPKGPINNIPALVQIMAWRRPGDKPLSEPMIVSLLTNICFTRPQWVKKKWIKNKHQKVRAPIKLTNHWRKRRWISLWQEEPRHHQPSYWPRVTLVSAPEVLKHITYLEEWHKLVESWHRYENTDMTLKDWILLASNQTWHNFLPSHLPFPKTFKANKMEGWELLSTKYWL